MTQRTDYFWVVFARTDFAETSDCLIGCHTYSSLFKNGMSAIGEYVDGVLAVFDSYEDAKKVADWHFEHKDFQKTIDEFSLKPSWQIEEDAEQNEYRVLESL